MHEHHHHSHYHIHTNERSTRIVVLLTFVTMLTELYFGYRSNSRALIMDGWHMLSHVMVLGLAWLAYAYIKHKKGAITPQQQQKIISLSGFASAVVMLVVTLHLVYESVEKFNMHTIEAGNASIGIACVALLVNGVSAFFLHREEEKRDINLHAAYLHVLSDVVLSFFAIISLLAVRFLGIKILDAVLSIAGAAIILKWSIELIRKSWHEVLEPRA